MEELVGLYIPVSCVFVLQSFFVCSSLCMRPVFRNFEFIFLYANLLGCVV